MDEHVTKNFITLNSLQTSIHETELDIVFNICHQAFVNMFGVYPVVFKGPLCKDQLKVLQTFPWESTYDDQTDNTRYKHYYTYEYEDFTVKVSYIYLRDYSGKFYVEVYRKDVKLYQQIERVPPNVLTESAVQKLNPILYRDRFLEIVKPLVESDVEQKVKKYLTAIKLHLQLYNQYFPNAGGNIKLFNDCQHYQILLKTLTGEKEFSVSLSTDISKLISLLDAYKNLSDLEEQISEEGIDVVKG